MKFEYVSGLSWPGDPAKPNDDAFCHSERLAAVFDGATSLGEPLLAVDSDAAWIARKGAEALIAHAGLPPREALARTAEAAERDFVRQRKRPPKENFELPLASMMLAGVQAQALEFLWFGDCAAIVRPPGKASRLVGDALEKRAGEARRARRLAERHGLDPAAGVDRPEYLDALRKGRNLVNTRDDGWAFAPDARCAGHARSLAMSVPEGTEILLCSDGFLALASDYARYGIDELIEAAVRKGLKPLFDEIRAIEEADPNGRTYPRFKKSDDATGLLLSMSR